MEKALHHEHGRYRPIDEFSGAPKPNDNWPYHGYPTTPHDREYGIRDPKFEKHIFIRRDQVFVDLDSQIGIVADMRRKPDGGEESALSQGTEKYRPMFYRWIDSHIGEAKTIMSAFVLEKSRETSMNSIKDVEEVDIALFMPVWYDDTTFPQLTNAVHDYVVDATLHDYFKLTLTSKDPVTVDKEKVMSDRYSELKKLVNASKPGTIRKPYNPF